MAETLYPTNPPKLSEATVLDVEYEFVMLPASILPTNPPAAATAASEDTKDLFVGSRENFSPPGKPHHENIV